MCFPHYVSFGFCLVSWFIFIFATGSVRSRGGSHFYFFSGVSGAWGVVFVWCRYILLREARGDGCEISVSCCSVVVGGILLVFCFLFFVKVSLVSSWVGIAIFRVGGISWGRMGEVLRV